MREGHQSTAAAEVEAFLKLIAAASAPSFTAMTPLQARAAVAVMVSQLDASAAPGLDVQDTSYGAADQRLSARIYTPPGAVLTDAAMIFFHGGGWMTGSIDIYDSFCRFLALELGMPVLSADYRLAPEAPFPAAYDDAIAAITWATDAGGPFAQAKRIVLAGDSAGANLAAAAAQTFARTAVPIAAQMLLYPVLDISRQSSSYRTCGEGNLLTRSDMEHFITSYVPDPALRTDRRCSPLLANDLHTLAPTVVLACALDPLRDEARAYAAELARAGVTVSFVEARGQIHGLATLRRAIPSAEATLRCPITLLKNLID